MLRQSRTHLPAVVSITMTETFRFVSNKGGSLLVSHSQTIITRQPSRFLFTLFASAFPILYWKYRVISDPIHFPTGTDTPFPIIRYASLLLPENSKPSGTPCNRAYSRTVYGRAPRGNRRSATSLVLKSLA